MRPVVLISWVVLACARLSHAGSTGGVIFMAYRQATSSSVDVNTFVKDVTLFNLPYTAPRVPVYLGDIADILSDCVSTLSGTASAVLPATDSSNVVMALKDFAYVHQQLLTTLIGKHAFLGLAAFNDPIKDALVSLKTVVDNLATAVHGRLDAASQTAATEHNTALDAALTSAIQTYASSLLVAGADGGDAVVQPAVSLARKMLLAA